MMSTQNTFFFKYSNTKLNCQFNVNKTFLLACTDYCNIGKNKPGFKLRTV